ncbi:MAG: hypothetical protein DM484_06735 [Candidatus Methylumidiphilus alinenensis]|uniref:Uncharacterized protein n=1 Tax=Candidatus Methylumidiphilus alinenensis TaxID=2202197 RepID=A0A2W4TI63_9GAMM|nr:MAG: hypothetical protein DM484_06735 [Candidatus Methylumidiphilus alinenensis]
MASFALITEGITDQAVLENILTGLYGDDVEVNPLQPLRDATDTSRIKSDSFGGWEQVFEYCQHENFDELLIFNDYVIIQIDSDCGYEVNFGVPLTHGGKDRPVEELVDEVRQKIISKINKASYEQHQNQFKFAIAVHSLECWLLPLFLKEKAHLRKTKNCFHQLELETERLKIDCKKEYLSYKRLSKPYQNAKQLENAKLLQQSLGIFVNSLPSVKFFCKQLSHNDR